MNDDINVEGIELEPNQVKLCKELLDGAKLEPFVSKEIFQRVLAVIHLAMKVGIKSERDMFEDVDFEE